MVQNCNRKSGAENLIWLKSLDKYTWPQIETLYHLPTKPLPPTPKSPSQKHFLGSRKWENWPCLLGNTSCISQNKVHKSCCCCCCCWASTLWPNLYMNKVFESFNCKLESFEKESNHQNLGTSITLPTNASPNLIHRRTKCNLVGNLIHYWVNSLYHIKAAYNLFSFFFHRYDRGLEEVKGNRRRLNHPTDSNECWKPLKVTCHILWPMMRDRIWSLDLPPHQLWWSPLN